MPETLTTTVQAVHHEGVAAKQVAFLHRGVGTQPLGQRVPHRSDEVQGFVGQGAGGHGW